MVLPLLLKMLLTQARQMHYPVEMIFGMMFLMIMVIKDM
jgi:hypothetical protein